MELRQLKHFLAVAETGSFTKGSQRAAISQPALSASIARLEDELEVKLFERRRSLIVPTVAGAKLLEKAHSLFLVYNTVKTDVRDAMATAPLHVGVLQTLSTAPVASLIRSFRRARPELEFEIFDGSEDELRRRVADRRLDVAFSTLPEEGCSSIASRRLFTERLVLAVPLDHRLANRPSVKLADLDNERFIARAECEGYCATIRAMVDRGLKARITYKTDQEDRALALVSAGVGITMVPELFSFAGIRKLKIADFEYQRSIAVQWLSDSTHHGFGAFVTAAMSHDWSAQGHA